MHQRKVLLGLAAAVAIGALACGDDDPAAPKAEQYLATMNTANEVAPPAVYTSPATGTAAIAVQGNTLTWTIHTQGFETGTTAPTGTTANLPAHIHFGPTTASGGIMVNLGAKINGDTSGTVTVVDSVLTHMRAGNAYVNVHTNHRSSGEIRGQLGRVQ